MQILDVLLLISSRFIKFPGTQSALDAITKGFEEMCGFPDAAGAVDGSLFRLERPFEYEGFVSCSRNAVAFPDSSIFQMDMQKRICSHQYAGHS